MKRILAMVLCVSALVVGVSFTHASPSLKEAYIDTGEPHILKLLNY